jgi:hypothetical protein
MTHELTTLTERSDPSQRSSRRRARGRHLRRTAVALAATVAVGALGAGTAGAATSEADVECNTAYNTITVRPRVLSNYANEDQWTATRVWIATWNSSTQSWQWQGNSWKVELASRRNNPAGHPIDLLEAQTFRKGDGYHYVYVQSYMWDGAKWYDPQGLFTRNYTLIQPSVSHEPDSRTSSTLCAI